MLPFSPLHDPDDAFHLWLLPLFCPPAAARYQLIKEKQKLMASLPRSLPLPYVSPERVHEILEELVIELKTLQQELGREPATEIN